MLRGDPFFHRYGSYFAELMNKSGRPILVEDCHWGGDGPGDWGDGGTLNQGPNKVPQDKWCPFNFFRTSGDIGNSFSSVMNNLQTVIKHQPWDNASQVRTGPGCWSYPDMLEVGNLASVVEDQTHFGAWCIVSAPLILGHDLANNDTNDKICMCCVLLYFCFAAPVSLATNFRTISSLAKGNFDINCTINPGTMDGLCDGSCDGLCDG
jgi:hypothetical protein